MQDYERDKIFNVIEIFFINEFSDEISLISQVKEISVNDYSYCFEFSSKGEDYFVKIPKFEQLVLRKDKPVLTFSNEDILFAKAEYFSLLKLRDQTKVKDISCIEVIVYIEEINAIITKKFHGNDFYLLLRQYYLDLSKNSQKRTVLLFDNLISFYISAIQNVQDDSKEYHSKETISKIQRYISSIGADKESESIFLENELKMTNLPTKRLIIGFKGFDIRNVIYSDENILAILDPGKEKIESIESYFSRIYATLIIIYWGHLFLFFGTKLHKDLLDSFEERIMHKVNPITFHLELRKELYKHWDMALFALRKKRWPKFIKDMLQTIYVDSFYKKVLKENKLRLIDVLRVGN